METGGVRYPILSLPFPKGRTNAAQSAEAVEFRSDLPNAEEEKCALRSQDGLAVPLTGVKCENREHSRTWHFISTDSVTARDEILKF